MKGEELAAILNQLGADGACPFCKTNDWVAETVSSSEDDLAVISVVSFGKASHSPDESVKGQIFSNHEGYLLSCAHCGFIRIHNKTIIEGVKHG